MLKAHSAVDSDLLLQISEGNEQAFQILFNINHPIVYSYAIKIIRSAYMAEEIVQEVFLKIWINREALAEINNFGAYLRVITRNYTFTVLKQIAQENALKNSVPDNFDYQRETEDQIDFRETREILNQALNTLPPQQKLVYNMYHLQGLKKEEVAEELKISPLTVKAHLRQAVQSVRKFMHSRLSLFTFF
jgi:RNA polymerase sigma-70 factor (family 1)